MYETEDVLSFRTHLTTGLQDFTCCLDEATASTEAKEVMSDLLAELVAVLSSYQEEGSHLFPVVFLGSDLQQTILAPLNGQDAITVGTGPLSRRVIQTAFKQCAPLSEGRQWSIFFEFKADSVQYGIFRTDQSPLSATAFEKLRLLRDRQVPLVGITRFGGSFVEIRNGSGHYRYIDVSGRQEAANNPPRVIRQFLQAIGKDAPLELRPKLEAFYYRLGLDLLHATHGTLIAVVPAERGVPSILQDGILFDPPISIVEAISRYLERSDNDSYQRLYSFAQLFRRMISVDGITVLSTDGSLLGYNCFIQNSIIDARSKGIWGGARRRAFEALCSFLGRDLAGVLYRSQDGVGDFRLR